jgi:peptidoglycan biosynthesis protein MviN/MurJ (putative lipid II flippase)
MKLPKIVGFAVSILIAYTILKYTNVSEEFFLGAIVSSFLIYLTGIFYRRKQIKKQREGDGKKWMFEDIIMNQGALGGIALIPVHLYNTFTGLTDISSMNEFWIGALSLFICSFYLFIYIMLVEIPQMADEYLEQTYPEYKLV